MKNFIVATIEGNTSVYDYAGFNTQLGIRQLSLISRSLFSAILKARHTPRRSRKSETRQSNFRESTRAVFLTGSTL